MRVLCSGTYGQKPNPRHRRREGMQRIISEASEGRDELCIVKPPSHNG